MKHVTFGVEKTYLFGVDYNGSALPKESGPPIGLARIHHTMTVEHLDDIAPRRRRVRRFDHNDRIHLLKPLYDAKSLALFCCEAIDIRRGRIETAENLALNESRLRARMHKRATEVAPRPAKRQRMMSGIMEYDEDMTFGVEKTYLFGVDYNGSALPKESGPPIGLARIHHTMTVEHLDDIAPRRGRVRRFDHNDRIHLLKPLYDAKSLALFCYEAIDVRKSRIDTEDEYLQNESRLRERMRKQAAEMMVRPAKRQRMMSTLMEYEDDNQRSMPTQVAFSTATTYLFGVDYNGSAIPKETGPGIGLARKHHASTIERVEDIAPRRSRVRKYNHNERLALLKPLYDAKSLAEFCYEAIDVRKSRIETEDELLQNEYRLQERARKRAAEQVAPVDAKRRRMLPAMAYEDDSTDEESDEEDDTLHATAWADPPYNEHSAPTAKRVRFTTETTYFFDIAYGGSALPSESGPPIGLAPSHCHRTTAALASPAAAPAKRRAVRKFDHLERIELLKAADYHVKDIAQFCFEAMDVRNSRKDTRARMVLRRRRAAARRMLRHRRPRMMQPILSDSSDAYSSEEDEDESSAMQDPTLADCCSLAELLPTPASPLSVDCEIADLVDNEPAIKRVHFGTATTYVFNVAHGGSALPKKAGPAIGMARYHCDVECVNLGDSKVCVRGRVRKFDHLQRVEMLKKAAYSGRDIADFCMDAIAVRKSRAETASELRRKRKHTAACDDTPAMSKRRSIIRATC
ncbi:hypothetical protein ACHHYP_15224 [Achlya hypogyna]|uniref:Uncharacterized protein n=1 Tax=Achlya hypogyna TaxID=1202772 RepID=A0A1V9YB88_ACHHY|nr:hypothetical protein ACHHYP_15224 [Achlya hypogyna]